MEFPILLYRTPGPHHGMNGKTFAYTSAENSAQAKELLSDGWHENLETACGVKPVDETTPPTRDELKTQAGILRLTYPKNISNEKLLEAIEAKLAEE